TPAAPVSPASAYRIGSGDGRILAQVSGSSATTSVASPTGSALESWTFQPTGDGAYTIVNSGSGQALGVASATTATRAWGTKPTVSTLTGAVGQQWFVIKSTSPSASYRLVNRYSGLALAMSPDATRLAETTPVRAWTNTTGSPIGGTRTAAEQTLTLTTVGQAPNLALNKPATAQSSEGGHTPDKAVDTDPASYWAGGPVPQWWQVDLQGVYQLSNVNVTNYFADSRSYQYNIQASVNGTTWTTVATKSNTSPATSAGDSYPLNAVARYLRVTMTFNSANGSGHITNVVVNGVPALNLALNKPATAQSSEGGHTPDKAVDADPASYWAAGPVPQWWQVDLQDLYTLDNVTVTNYYGDSRSYQYNIQASVNGTTWTTIATKSGTSPATSAGDSHAVNAQARYLRVNMTSNSANSSAHITNVIVNGQKAPNLALGKPATAQSSEGGHTPDKAVDTDPASYWAAGPVPQWWQVDLQATYQLSNVTVTNYHGDTRSYQYNIQASTDGTTWTTIATKSGTTPATSAGDSHAVNAQARYLRVTITSNSANTSAHITNMVVNGL
ncbi:discoidin domain-containing protein, partial [Sphaerisporangium krabiense]